MPRALWRLNRQRAVRSERVGDSRDSRAGVSFAHGLKAVFYYRIFERGLSSRGARAHIYAPEILVVRSRLRPGARKSTWLAELETRRGTPSASAPITRTALYFFPPAPRPPRPVCLSRCSRCRASSVSRHLIRPGVSGRVARGTRRTERSGPAMADEGNLESRRGS